MPGWRRNLAWPLAHGERCDILKAQMRALIEFICAAPDEMRDILSLAAQVLTHNAKVLADTALTLNYADQRGLHFSGERPELAFLRGDVTTPEQSARSWNPPMRGAGPRFLASKGTIHHATSLSLAKLSADATGSASTLSKTNMMRYFFIVTIA